MSTRSYIAEELKDGKYKEIASFYNKQDLATYDLLNGKIVAECDFEVEEMYQDSAWIPNINSELLENYKNIYYL